MSSLKRSIIEATIGRVFAAKVTIVATTEIAPKLWRLDLQSDNWRGTRFTPGDKLQVVLDDGPRTYSPFSVDPAKGTLSVIVYAHGSASSGARWGPAAKVGDAIQILGPRGSIPLPELGESPVIVGDETGLGIARAFYERQSFKARYVFETDSADAMTKALSHLELPGAEVVVRRAGDAHLPELGDRLVAAINAPATGVALTGRAATIQALRARLKAAGPKLPQRVKAYWAPGKRGLD